MQRPGPGKLSAARASGRANCGRVHGTRCCRSFTAPTNASESAAGAVSSVRSLGWLRAGGEHLALVTNGYQWRLIFAGLDYDAWCEWDVDLWFEEGGLSSQVTALRTLLQPRLFTPETKDASPPLLQAIHNTRKGQAELSEVLGERVREAVEILIQGYGDTLRDQADEHQPADIYRAACRVIMRLVIVLFAEARELLPRSNPVYHENYGLNGLLERLERVAVHGAGRLASQYSAWPRILALFRLVREGSHHPGPAGTGLWQRIIRAGKCCIRRSGPGACGF